MFGEKFVFGKPYIVLKSETANKTNVRKRPNEVEECQRRQLWLLTLRFIQIFV